MKILFLFAILSHTAFVSLLFGSAGFLVFWTAKENKSPENKNTVMFFLKIFFALVFLCFATGILVSFSLRSFLPEFVSILQHTVIRILFWEKAIGFPMILFGSFLLFANRKKIESKVFFCGIVLALLGILVVFFLSVSANSFLQTPTGFLEDPSTGKILPTNWMQLVFSPSCMARFFHFAVASLLSFSFFAAGIYSHFLLQGKRKKEGKGILRQMILFAFFATFLQMLLGHMHGCNTAKYQPAKFAAMEGILETKTNVPLIVFGIPNMEKMEIEYTIGIPNLCSKLVGQKTISGLKDFCKTKWPRVYVVFFAFRIMVGLGILMLLWSIWGLWQIRRKRFDAAFLKTTRMVLGIGIAATLAGWIVTECGRYPFLVYSQM